MKKLLAGILVTAMVLTTGSVTAFARGGRGGRGGCGYGYVDADGDGVCDNYTQGKPGYGCGGYVDKDGDGICDNCGRPVHGNGCGYGYVDADGDGVCDNYTQGKPGGGRGGRYGQGGGKGRHGR